MQDELTKILDDTSYDDTEDMDIYTDYTPHKMSKKEFVKEMLRLQSEKNLFAD